MTEQYYVKSIFMTFLQELLSRTHGQNQGGGWRQGREVGLAGGRGWRDGEKMQTTAIE